jgi:hypothetical protein
MEGMKFLILSKGNKPINHGTIAERITAEKYLCQFDRTPTSCRVCRIEEIEGWNLFPTDEDMNAFTKALAPKKPPAPPPPADPPADPPKTNGSKTNAKKSKAKKKAKPKPKK